MLIFTHRIPFDAKEVLFMATVADMILREPDLREEFDQKIGTKINLPDFANRIRVFVENAEKRIEAEK